MSTQLKPTFMQCQMRNALARYLRTQGFQVSTAPNFLHFNNYAVQFDESTNYMQVHNPYSRLVRLDIPYSAPALAVNKIRKFYGLAPVKQ